MKSHTLPGVLCSVLLSCSIHAQADPYAALPSLDFGKENAARAAIEKAIRDGGPAQYSQVEEKLLAALQQPGATQACRKFVCDTLRIVGSPACVKAMAGLLGDEKNADLARLALESLPGPAVDEALLQAVKSATGLTRIGLIQTLAARRHAALVELAKGWLGSGDAELMRATLLALGRVGGSGAVEVLKSAQVPQALDGVREGALVEAAFLLARQGGGAQAMAVFQEEFRSGRNQPAVIAALNGLVDSGSAEAPSLLIAALKDSRNAVALAAVRASTRVKDPAVAQGLIAALPSLPPNLQVPVLHALADRGDKSALPAIQAVWSSPEETVKTEAALALEKLGDASFVDELASLATGSGAAAQAAQQTLSRLNAPGTGEAIAALLDAPDPAQVRVAALTLRARADHSAVPRLLKMAGSENAASRAAALEALDGLAGTEEMPALLTLLRTAPDNAREKVASALWKATRSLGTEDERFVKLWAQISAESEPVKLAILSLGSTAAGTGSLGIVTSTLQSGSDALKDAAARTLCNWPSEAAVGPLTDLVRQPSTPTHRILAARAVVRLLSDRKCTWPAVKKVAALESLLPLMEREQEKAMLRGALSKFGAQPK